MVGGKRARGRVLDVSEAGLCVISPVELSKGDTLDVEVDVPRAGVGRVRAEVWHVREGRTSATKRSAWSAGMSIVSGDDLYALLVRTEGKAGAAEDGEEPDGGVFRVRVGRDGEPRTRLLTLSASSAAEAEALAIEDLGPGWSVLEVQSES